MAEQQNIHLDAVGAHLSRKARFFENEAMILADQVRELVETLRALEPKQPPAVAGETTDFDNGGPRYVSPDGTDGPLDEDGVLVAHGLGYVPGATE